MKEIARLELGYYWPDGRRAYMAVDNEGQRYRGVLDEPDLAQDLRERGRRRAAEYTWARTAELTAAAYAEVAP